MVKVREERRIRREEGSKEKGVKLEKRRRI
jgi:hypothetical protein